jgi:hypothetical protein
MRPICVGDGYPGAEVAVPVGGLDPGPPDVVVGLGSDPKLTSTQYAFPGVSPLQSDLIDGF